MEHWKCEDCGDPTNPGVLQCKWCLYRYMRIEQALHARLTPDEVLEMDLEEVRQNFRRPLKRIILPSFNGRRTVELYRQHNSGGRRVIHKSNNFD